MLLIPLSPPLNFSREPIYKIYFGPSWHPHFLINLNFREVEEQTSPDTGNLVKPPWKTADKYKNMFQDDTQFILEERVHYLTRGRILIYILIYILKWKEGVCAHLYRESCYRKTSTALVFVSFHIPISCRQWTGSEQTREREEEVYYTRTRRQRLVKV